MIYPDFLKQGSCIGVPAPSSGAYNNLYNNRYNNAKKKLEEKGYKVVLSKNIFNSYKMRSAPAKERAEELNKMIENKNINFIICAAGGEFLVEMLPYVNLQKIQTNPKFIQGFSDPTGILFPVTTKYDIANEFNEKYKNDGIIWYFDNCELSKEELIRTIWKLNELDYFKYAKAIIFGRNGEETSCIGYTMEEALQDSVISNLNIPIIYDTDISHKGPCLTIINGAIATIKYANKRGSIDFELK